MHGHAESFTVGFSYDLYAHFTLYIFCMYDRGVSVVISSSLAHGPDFDAII